MTRTNTLLGWRLAMTTATPPPSPRPRRPRRSRIAWLLAAVPVALAMSGATAMASDPSGSVSATVVTATRSISVSPNSVTYGSCGNGNVLPFPNGHCTVGAQANLITVTNGSATAHIEENGSDFVPQDGLTPHWTLCGGAGPACTGPNPNNTSALPGPDQAQERDDTTVNNAVVYGPYLTNSPQCDTSFSSGTSDPCQAAPAQSVAYSLILFGPQSSTDNSGSFTTTLTWTAAP